LISGTYSFLAPQSNHKPFFGKSGRASSCTDNTGGTMIPFNHWSYSKLTNYLRCPAQFMFRYIEEAEPESTSIALLLGSTVHGAATYRAAVATGAWPGAG